GSGRSCRGRVRAPRRSSGPHSPPTTPAGSRAESRNTRGGPGPASRDHCRRPRYLTTVGMFLTLPALICAWSARTLATMAFGTLGLIEPRPEPPCLTPKMALLPPLKVPFEAPWIVRYTRESTVLTAL